MAISCDVKSPRFCFSVVILTNLETIREAVDYINSHLEETLTLDRVTRQANYSKYHLSKIQGAGLYRQAHPAAYP